MARTPAAPRRCPTCGAANASFATFCLECGDPLDALPPRRVIVGAAGPPRAPAARPWPYKEVVLGVLLVVLVAGFGLVDWWHTESQVQTYRVGVAAAAARHWDAAQAAFARVGDYRDASQRQRDAANKILLRNTSYEQGQNAAGREDWIASYAAFSQTLAIEPDYRSARAQQDFARDQITQAALTNTVYRLHQGAAPGLYLRRDAGTPDQLLPESDAQSQVWLADGKRYIIYDGPALPEPPPYPLPRPADPLLRFFPHLGAGRRLLVGDMRTPGKPPVVLPAAVTTGDYLVLGSTGIWAFILSRTSGTPLPGRAPDIGLALGLTVYYDFTSGAVTPSPLGGDGTYLLDADTASGRIILARYRPEDRGPAQTTLYLGGDGGSLQPVAQLTGICTIARVSPDGQAVLYTLSVGGKPKPHLDLALLDLRAPVRQPQVLRSLDLSFEAEDSTARLRGIFIPGNAPPRILIQESQYGDTRLLLHDLTDGADTILRELRPVTYIYRSWLTADGQAVFLDERDGLGSMHVVLQPLDGDHPATIFPLPPGPNAGGISILDAAVQGDRVVYTMLDNLDNAAGLGAAGEEIYSAARQNPAARPVLLGLRAVLISQVLRGGSPQLQVLPAGMVLAAGQGGELRLRTLDGQVELPVLPGADAVWLYRPPPSLLRF